MKIKWMLTGLVISTMLLFASCSSYDNVYMESISNDITTEQIVTAAPVSSEEDIICILEDSDVGDHYITDQSELSLALDMMVHYGMSFDYPAGNPGDEFWEKFANSLVLNSWFSPFSDSERIWDNDRIARAGSVLTGEELECTAFPENIDMQNAASPYLYNCANKNVTVAALDDGSYDITYDLVWADSSLTEIYGMERINAVISINPESPLNGFSVKKLNSETIYEPVTFLDTEFEIEQKKDGNEKYYEVSYIYEGEPSVILQVGFIPDSNGKYFARSRRTVSYEDNIIEELNIEITEEEYKLIESELERYKGSNVR